MAVAFGHCLRKFRLRAGLSQIQLGLLANYDRHYIGVLERGQRIPTLPALFRLARVLGVSAETLVGDTRSRMAGTECLVPYKPGSMRYLDHA
jgi:transcriptional regulator with XRE-family HTH domain